MTATLTQQDLDEHTSTDCYYQHRLVKAVRYTSGVQFLAQKGHAYWLLDKIATMQLDPKVRAQDFQSWKLMVTNGTATLTCEDGNEGVIHSEHITFTDFPLPEVSIWVEGGVILLPSEH